MSKAINDDQIIGTRAIAAEPLKKLKRQLEAKDGELFKKEKVIKKLKARVELAEERLAEFKALKSECRKLSKEIEDRKEDNAILRKASGDREVTNISQIVSRTGPPESASKVTHQLRELFLGKIAEANYRTDEVQDVMTGMVTKIDTLTAQLRAEVKFNIELRASTRMTKALKKALLSGPSAAVPPPISGCALLSSQPVAAYLSWCAYFRPVLCRAFAYL
jgi:chromosome segregation ATPase